MSYMTNAQWMIKHNCKIHFSAQCICCRSSSSFYDRMNLHLVPPINVDWQFREISEQVLFQRLEELKLFCRKNGDNKSIDDMIRLTYIEIWRGRPLNKNLIKAPKPTHKEEYPIAIKLFANTWINDEKPLANYALFSHPSPWVKYFDAK